MQSEEFEKETLLKQKRDVFQDQRSREPQPLKKVRRPYKGIFLTYFLLFAGLLFFVHGFHRYEDYSWLDLTSVWVLSTMRICNLI